MENFKYDLDRSFSQGTRKNYHYRVKADDIKRLYNKIRYQTQPVGPKQWAKVKLAKLNDKLNKKLIIPGSLGFITVPASIGDTILAGFKDIKFERIPRSDNQEIEDREWNKMWWQK